MLAQYQAFQTELLLRLRYMQDDVDILLISLCAKPSLQPALLNTRNRAAIRTLYERRGALGSQKRKSEIVPRMRSAAGVIRTMFSYGPVRMLLRSEVVLTLARHD